MLWYGRRRFGASASAPRQPPRRPELTPRLWRIGWPECTICSVLRHRGRPVHPPTRWWSPPPPRWPCWPWSRWSAGLRPQPGRGPAGRRRTRTVLVASLAGDAFLAPWPGCSASPSASAWRGLMLAWLAYGLVFVAVSWWRYRTVAGAPAPCRNAFRRRGGWAGWLAALAMAPGTGRRMAGLVGLLLAVTATHVARAS